LLGQAARAISIELGKLTLEQRYPGLGAKVILSTVVMQLVKEEQQTAFAL
jgi:hypothetical protein